MGRELKRVPLDFKWPIDKLWKGYINPTKSKTCECCSGEGLNPQTKQLSEDWYDFADTGRRWCDNITEIEVAALVKSRRLMDFTHTFTSGEGWKEKEPAYVPTPEEVNRWNAGPGMGHDAINRWICVKARATHLGIYGKCRECKGTGTTWDNRRVKHLHMNWKEFDPPKGKGYQLWSTTTEGHPMSPVFSSLHDLCNYLVDYDISVFGYNGTTYENWYNMLDDGFVSHREGNAVFI